MAKRTNKTKALNSVILYTGPSMLDGSPIVVIATGLDKARKSANNKTGAMVQTWILRQDIDPRAAANNGSDSSICGDCQLRGTIENGKNKNRSCYVTLWQAPRNIYATYLRGKYSDKWDSATFAGLKFRLGSYGDPAAVPLYVWERALALTAGHTGYTHQWRIAPELAAYCMASADSEADRIQARMLGFRTFRVRRISDAVLPKEVTCPASKEAGHKTQCDACLACGGNTAKAKADIVIAVHGSAPLRKNFNKRAA
jgi:hypothetical protein